EREGDIFGCADFWVNQSANPFSFRHHNHLAVMWRNFFLTQRSSHMRTISYLLAFACLYLALILRVTVFLSLYIQQEFITVKLCQI
ncbi:hypothetical protein, partial [Acinetobacter baumannii]